MNFFDRYSRKARVQPALLAIFPFFVTLLFLYFKIYVAASTLFIPLALSCGVLMFISNIVRYFGRKIEEKLYNTWGGSPTIRWLRHRDNKIDSITKNRYHNFLLNNISGLRFPTSDEEKMNPASADDSYKSAVIWLLEYTRDQKKFPLVFAENINYGFRRNMLSIKPLAIFIVVLSQSILLFYVFLSSESLTRSMETLSIPFSVSMAAGFIWTCIVSPEWVKDASESYARILLASCNQIS